MNWRAFSRKNLVFVFLWMMGFLVSCQKPKELGIDLQGNTDKIKIYFTDTLTVKTSTVLLDTVVSSNPITLLTGQYLDPVIGKVTAKSFFQVIPGIGGDTITVPTGAVADSMILYMNLVGFYGDTTVQQTFDLYRLNETLLSQDYYNFSSAGYNSGNKLGTKTISLGKQGISTNMEFKMSNTFRDEVFELFKQKTSTDVFRTIVQGFAFIPSNTNAAIATFSMGGFGSRLIIYYHYTDAGGSVVNKQNTYFVNPPSSFNNIQWDGTGTSLAALNNGNRILSSNLTGNQSFINTGLGIVTKVEIPYLDELKKLGKVSINKADLIVFAGANTISDKFLQPTGLSLFRVDNSNRLFRLSTGGFFYPLQEEGQNPYNIASPANLAYNSIGTFYKNAISTYFQLYFLGQENKNGLFLSEQFYVLSGTTIVANFSPLRRLVVENNPASANKVRLELFYTVVK